MIKKIIDLLSLFAWAREVALIAQKRPLEDVKRYVLA